MILSKQIYSYRAFSNLLIHYLEPIHFPKKKKKNYQNIFCKENTYFEVIFKA